MATYKVLNPIAINNDDILLSSATPDYPVGMEACIQKDEDSEASKFIYVKAHAALTVNQPYAVVESDATDGEITTDSLITLASAVTLVGVPQIAIASGEFGWVQVQGVSQAKVDAAITAGHRFEIFTSGSAFTTTGAATKTINTVGMCITATTAAATTAVMLAGHRVEVQAT